MIQNGVVWEVCVIVFYFQVIQRRFRKYCTSNLLKSVQAIAKKLNFSLKWMATLLVLHF